MTDRTKSFTNAEFQALPRYPNGCIQDLPMHFMWLTNAQKEKLHGDDWSYLDDLEEEARIMHQQARAEFGY